MSFTPYPKDSDVLLLTGVPLNKNYEHTVLQSSAQAQVGVFQAYLKRTFSDQSYQRCGKNKIRLAVLADDIYDVNYMMFKNSAYGNKWFYAFVTDVEYLNDHTTEITYEIDVMQTWYFEFSVAQVFVEREHSLTDDIDDNLLEEDIPCGDYVLQQSVNKTYDFASSEFGNYTCYANIFYVANEKIIRANKDPSTGEITNIYTVDASTLLANGRGTMNNYMFIGCTLFQQELYLADGAQRAVSTSNLGQIITGIVENGGNIVAIQVVPRETDTTETFHIDESDHFSGGGGYYTPKNKKLLRYPFKKLILLNSQGQQKEYKWEMFSALSGVTTKRAMFTRRTVAYPTAQAHVYPDNYRAFLQEGGLTFEGFPTYTWSEDSFARWWQQNGASTIFSLIGSTILSIANLAMAKGIGGRTANYLGSRTALNSLQDLVGVGSSIIQAEATPDTINGNANGDVVAFAENRLGFKLCEMCIREDYAKSIDDFFSMYGYAVNRLKVPNIYATNINNLRPYWNYIKTRNCVVNGSRMNSKDEEKICEIFNNGITFWTALEHVGHYSYDNSPR